MSYKYVNLKIVAPSDEDLLDFLSLCMAIQEAGDKGESRTITVTIDGDGSGKLSFIKGNGDSLPSARAENDRIYIGE